MGSRALLDARSLLILFSYILLSNWIRRGHYWLENAIWSYFTSLKVQKAAIFEVPVLFLNSACQRQKGVWTCCSSIWIKHVVCFINLIYKLKFPICVWSGIANMGSWVRLGRGFSLYLLYRNRYFFCRTFNVPEVLSMLEDVGEFEEASIYIEPSPVAAITDEDSADEDEGGTYSNLNWNQLLAGSCVSVLMQGVSTYLQQIKVSQKGMEHHQRMEEIWFKMHTQRAIQMG